MRPEIYKQYDKRWKDLPYPGHGAYLDDSGCGCLAVYHAAIERDTYKNLTVPQCRDYMVQYATVKNGTLWDGITKGLEHYGYNVHWRESDSMDDVFNQLKSSLKSGIILFAKKDAWSYGPDGTLWTKSGHYIYFGDYEIRSDGTHWFYLKDSSDYEHDGWYCFEKSMKGCCRNVWICKSAKDSPAPTPTPDDGRYHGLYPSVRLYLEPGDKGENVTRLQNYLDWYFDGAFFKECGKADGVYGKNTLKWTNKMLTDFFGAAEADGKVGPKTIARMQTYSKKDPKPTPTPSHKGEVLDVSDFQDDIDWSKAKADGVTGVIVRCGLRGGEKGDLRQDNMFLKHIAAAYKAGLKVGVYMFTTAINAKEGKEEAVYALNQIQKAGLPMSYPIAIDTENVFWSGGGKGRANSDKLSKAKRTEAVKAFCEEMKAQGYEPMIYASLSWFRDCLDMSKLPYKVWVAQYNTTCQYEGEKALWQYTSTGRISGYGDVVDMNKNYLPDNYDPKLEPTPEPTPTPPTPEKQAYPGTYPTDAEMYAAQIGGMAQACKDQTSWAYDSVYKWESYPTVPKSKIKGTCVTYVACALQRIAIMSEGQYIWHDGKGYGTGKVTHANSLMTVTYYNNKKTLKDIALKTCDIVLYDDNKSGKSGEGGHIEIFNGSKNANNSFFYSGGLGSHHNTSNSRKEPNSRKVLAVVRVKYRGYIRKGDRGAAVLKWQDYLDWWSNGQFYKECGKGDGIFGNNTHKWTVKFQEEVIGKGQGDGTVGPKTITAAKSVKK